MPAQVAHFLLGEQALLSLPEDQRTGIRLDYFALGCQGPDIFYHNQRTRPSAFLYGGRLHKRAYGQFTALWAQKGFDSGWSWDSPQVSFLAGWVTHAVLDRLLHPYIVYHGGWKDPQKPETAQYRKGHILVERILDVVLYEQISKRNFDGFSFLPLWESGLPIPVGFLETMANALWRVFPSVFYWEEAVPRISNAWNDTLGFLQFTDPAKGNAVQAAALDREDDGNRLAIFHPGILPPDDFLNLQKRSWRHPVTGAMQNDSVLDLFKTAVTQASQNMALLARFWQGKAKAEELEAALGNSSLNLPGEDGDSDGPVFMEPWDILHLLNLQRRFWLKE